MNKAGIRKMIEGFGKQEKFVGQDEADAILAKGDEMTVMDAEMLGEWMTDRRAKNEGGS